ncbi:MAG: recombinase family protein, partial [Proteobacteria bacterium]|nr:recombinase family protein [Pseudomonadota bacterium]
RLVLNVLASVSQWEREAIGEKTAAAMAHLRDQGKRIGAVPFGFQVNGTDLVPDPLEQDVLTIARDLHDAGMSLRAIARELDLRGFQSRSDKVFAATQIKRMVA